MKPSATFLILAIYMALAAAVHVFFGGPAYADAFAEELSTDKLRAMATGIWHCVTVALVLLLFGYARMAWRPSMELLVFTSALQVGWALLFLYVGYSWLGNVMTIPQWAFFLVAPAIAHVAAWRTWPRH